ncbi:anthraniloyl-CoA monooxygenase [Thermosporothrix hazakensis]|jgi:anthraniloyl-CoA monooxygenase|uniref:Anthraniloyl-CoA monooxygenase n=2 Tax=Thermosporothrix TaxID=768650 RepID=A0A326UKF9_THEHA|nr:FAD-dependent monooxygenase [Thermosporothrix hazakensis]PZW29437.1 anthraniloyl-CoA monooxygenase [Thermosporothrix hazakensis]BBH85723.1 salicylyl-CoA 5-hydroxylase [Thermosporothrix sp. COM3]GCE45848.1 salicylyl-CoA 5-hydroxylase [Thermosporothrix hazakensis]
MKIIVAGGGPAGLYSALLLKKAHRDWEITVLERNPADVTYGWGVVFSDRTLASFQRADYKSFEQISEHFVIWDAIDVHYRDEVIQCGGHVIASIARHTLLHILQQRCLELGVTLCFRHELHGLAELNENYDLLIAADGIHSVVRRELADVLRPAIELGKARYIWLGVDRVLDAFTFLFRENEHGLFQVHAYPSSGTSSTFIVECHEDTWLRAGLDQASEAESVAYCQRLFARDLKGASLLANNSRWINFPTLKTRKWSYQNIVLLGDAVHTAHFSIGSGTKLAMEDAISLARVLELHDDLPRALDEYEQERRPVVELFQQAANESRLYFESISRYLRLEPLPFAFQLLTRSGRMTYDDLRLRDSRFGDAVDRWWARQRNDAVEPLVAPPPLFTPFALRGLALSNRIVSAPLAAVPAQDGRISNEYCSQMASIAASGAGLVLGEIAAVSPEGRITPHCPGLYQSEHGAAWKALVQAVHATPGARVGLQIGHAGRRGATRPRGNGLDRPLQTNTWPLLAPSPLPYTPFSQTPKAMDAEALERVRQAFVAAAVLAAETGADLLFLHCAHGYLLASFLSPLTNQRTDAYGGSLERRMRYPLEVFEAVRRVWPAEKPLGIVLSASDGVKGGADVEEAVQVATAFRERGCDLFWIQAGQTTPASELGYRRGYLTAFSDSIRNVVGLPTLVGGYLTDKNAVNTVLAASRADLCILESADSI